MTDPPRLLEQSSPGLAAALLEAGRDEKPSTTAVSRTLISIGAGAAVLTASSAAGGAAVSGAAGSAIIKSGAGTTSLGLVVKWLGIGTVGGVVTATAAYQLTPPVSAPDAGVGAPIAAVSAPPPKRAAPPAGVSPAPRGVSVESAEVAEAVEAAPRSGAPAPPRIRSAGVDPAAPLAAEVAFVDRARAAFQAGNYAGTLQGLARYESEFPGQRLQAEVLFLRMEAHGGLGDAASAQAVARRILGAYPKSPHAARARSVIGGLEKE